MKASDIKRLEKAVEHLRKAQELLSKTSDSLDGQPTEYFHFGSSGTSQTLARMVCEMCNDVSDNRSYIEGKVKVFKEEFLNK